MRPSTTDPAPLLGGTLGHDSRIARNFLSLGGGELLARLVGFGATVYIARQLGVEAYGILGFAFALMLYAAAVADLGIEQIGPREVADRDEPLDTLVASVLIVRFAGSAAMAAVLAVIGQLFLTQPEGSVLALYGLALLAVGGNAKWVHLGLNRPGIVSVSRIVAEATKVAAVVAFVRGPEDILLVPLAQVAGDVIGALILLAALPRAGIRLRAAFDRQLAHSVFTHARPMLLTHVLSLLIYNADVVMLRVFRDRTEVGLYLVAYTLINFIGALGTIVTVSLLPTLRQLRGDRAQRNGVYHTAFARAFAAGLPIAAGGAVLAPSILGLVFGAEYDASAAALAVLIWSFPLLLLRSVEQGALIAVGRQDRVLHTTLIAAVLNVGLNLVAVPMFGMVGAACTTLAAEATRCALSRWFAGRTGHTAHAASRLWRPVVATAVMAAVLLLLRQPPALLGVAAGAAVYVTVLALLGGVAWKHGRPVLQV